MTRHCSDTQSEIAPERLTFYNRHTASPVWTPDGRTILFYKNGAIAWRQHLAD